MVTLFFSDLVVITELTKPHVIYYNLIVSLYNAKVTILLILMAVVRINYQICI